MEDQSARLTFLFDRIQGLCKKYSNIRSLVVGNLEDLLSKCESMVNSTKAKPALGNRLNQPRKSNQNPVYNEKPPRTENKTFLTTKVRMIAPNLIQIRNPK